MVDHRFKINGILPEILFPALKSICQVKSSFMKIICENSERKLNICKEFCFLLEEKIDKRVPI